MIPQLIFWSSEALLRLKQGYLNYVLFFLFFNPNTQMKNLHVVPPTLDSNEKRLLLMSCGEAPELGQVAVDSASWLGTWLEKAAHQRNHQPSGAEATSLTAHSEILISRECMRASVQYFSITSSVQLHEQLSKWNSQKLQKSTLYLLSIYKKRWSSLGMPWHAVTINLNLMLGEKRGRVGRGKEATQKNVRWAGWEGRRK